MLISNYQSRIERTLLKTKLILQFLREESWSDVVVLKMITGLSSSGIYKTINQMQSQGLIEIYKIFELQSRVIGITQLGILASFDDENDFIPFKHFEISKFKTLLASHHLGLQRARLNAMNANWTNWKLGKHLQINWGNKPDAMVINTSGEKIAVELERTIKTRKRYEKIFSIYLQACSRNDLDFIDYVCLDNVFAHRLEKLFNSIRQIPVAGKRVTISQKHRDRIRIYCINNWPN